MRTNKARGGIVPAGAGEVDTEHPDSVGQVKDETRNPKSQGKPLH